MFDLLLIVVCVFLGGTISLPSILLGPAVPAYLPMISKGARAVVKVLGGNA